MRVVLQRVRSARVTVDDREIGRIDHGLLAYVGEGRDDGKADVEYVVGKVRELRVFEDDTGKMNRSLVDVGGDVLIVSQFTLYGDCRRGRRPSFDSAAPPTEARAVYDDLVASLRVSGLRVETGEFQAMMAVELVNDGPVTLIRDSRLEPTHDYRPSELEPMRRSLVLLTIAGEGALVIVALVWQRQRGLSLDTGGLSEGIICGVAAAVVFALANWYLLCGAPVFPGVTAIRRVYRTMFQPLFDGVGAVDVVVISMATGIGEELLFRGVLQTEFGLVPASLVFGLLHMGGSGAFAFGCWVAVMGGALGGLAVWTQGLLAPIIAHAADDAAALVYIRCVLDCAGVSVVSGH